MTIIRYLKKSEEICAFYRRTDVLVGCIELLSSQLNKQKPAVAETHLERIGI